MPYLLFSKSFFSKCSLFTMFSYIETIDAAFVNRIKLYHHINLGIDTVSTCLAVYLIIFRSTKHIKLFFYFLLNIVVSFLKLHPSLVHYQGLDLGLCLDLGLGLDLGLDLGLGLGLRQW